MQKEKLVSVRGQAIQKAVSVSTFSALKLLHEGGPLPGPKTRLLSNTRK